MIIQLKKSFIKKPKFQDFYRGKMTEKLLPVAAMEKILKKAGAERVAEDAQVALKEVLENIAYDIAVKSVKLAVHAKRKTIKSSDVKLAAKE